MDNSSQKNVIYTIIIKLVMALFGIISVYLFLLSICTTARISSSEAIYVTVDSPIKTGSIIALLLFIIAILFPRFKAFHVTEEFIKKMILVSTICLAALVCIQQLSPAADSLAVLNCAEEVYHGDVSSFYAGHYMNMYPSQQGLFLFDYLLTALFGGNNYLVFQLINCIAYYFFLLVLFKFSQDYVSDKTAGYIILSVIFSPISLYVTYAYGVILGLCFGILALYVIHKHHETHKIVSKELFFASVFLGIAYAMKPNFLILIVAVVCIEVLQFIRERRISFLFSIVMIILCFVGTRELVYETTNFLSGNTLAWEDDKGHKGESLSSLVVMGFQNDSYAGPGWYNDYPAKIYESCAYLTEAAREQSFEDLRYIVNNFIDEPSLFFQFLNLKNISMWSEPTFAGLMLNAMYHSTVTDPPIWWRSLVHDGSEFNRMIVFCMNIMQSLVYLGCVSFAFFFFKRKKDNIELGGVVFFIGCFLLHLFWEAQSQYVMLAYTAILPYALIGLKWLILLINGSLNSHIGHAETGRVNIVSCLPAGTSALLVLIVLWVFNIVLWRYGVFDWREDRTTEAYKEYLLTEGCPIESGYYHIATLDGIPLISCDDAAPVMDRKLKLWYHDVEGENYYSINQYNSSLHLAWYYDYVDDEYGICWEDAEPQDYYDSEFRWYLQKTIKEGYRLLCAGNNNLVLTCNEAGELCLDTVDDGKNQIWFIKK